MCIYLILLDTPPSLLYVALYENTEKLSSFVGKANEFDALFYVGGKVEI